MKKTMAGVKKKWWPLIKARWPVLVTVLYIGVIGSIRHDALKLIWSGELNEMGDFLAGFFTPLAFLWLVVGYFLQKEELHLQNEELGLQREELKEARQALVSQVKIMEKRDEAERRQSMPNFSLEELSRQSGPSGTKSQFALQNVGAPAHRLDLIYQQDSPYLVIRENKAQLKADERHIFRITDTSSSTNPTIHHYTVSFSSERHERFEQSWTITFIGNGRSLIEPTTDEPTPVIVG